MNERIYTLQSRNTLSAKWFAKHMFSYLDFRCYFEVNGQNHIHFRLMQVLKSSMGWHFLTLRSLSYKLEFVYMYPPWSCGLEEQMLIISSSLTLGCVNRRVEGSWNPIPKLTILLIWKTPASLKFGKTSNRAVENLSQRKLWVWVANIHTLSEETDPTKLRRVRAYSEMIDLRSLEFASN